MSLACRSISGARLCAQRRAPAPRAAPASRRPVQVKALFGGGDKGGGGNPFGDMAKLMESVKKAQSMVQQETVRVQQELATTEFDGYDEDETVIMTGNQEPKSVDITQAAIDAGPEELSKRVTTAMRDAHGKSVLGMKEKMKELAKNLGIPNPGALGGM